MPLLQFPGNQPAQPMMNKPAMNRPMGFMRKRTPYQPMHPPIGPQTPSMPETPSMPQAPPMMPMNPANNPILTAGSPPMMPGPMVDNNSPMTNMGMGNEQQMGAPSSSVMQQLIQRLMAGRG